jgi:subfamily B ATP-binding cassette protein HlyB/CyaB
MRPQREVGREGFIWVLESLSALFRVPFDASLLTQAFPPPYSSTSIHEGARSIGFKTGAARVASADWAKIPTPAIGFLLPQPSESPAGTTSSDGESESVSAATELTPALIIGISGDDVVYFVPGDQSPKRLKIQVGSGTVWISPTKTHRRILQRANRVGCLILRKSSKYD